MSPCGPARNPLHWGTQSRPAGGWSTRGRGPGEGRGCKRTAGPRPANRKAETGGPQVGLGVSYRRRRAGDELTRPLRVELGHTGSRGVDPTWRQPDHRELRHMEGRDPPTRSGGGGGRAEYDRETTVAGATRRPGRAGPSDSPGKKGRWHDPMRPNATVLARGVGHGTAGGGVNRIRQRGRETAAGPRPKKHKRGRGVLRSRCPTSGNGEPGGGPGG